MISRQDLNINRIEGQFAEPLIGRQEDPSQLRGLLHLRLDEKDQTTRARIAILSPDDLLERMDRRFELLRAPRAGDDQSMALGEEHSNFNPDRASQ